jgi:NADPH:quinone reductase
VNGQKDEKGTDMDYAVIARRKGGPEVLEVVDIPTPVPGPGEVLVRHTAIGLNFLDTYFRSGLYPWPAEVLTPGGEAAGVVEALGAGVTGFREGDRVAYTIRTGAYCSRRAVPADRLVHLPDAVSDDVAASVMLKGLTTHYLLHSCFAVQAGQTVLVHAAAGGVGLLMGQWLRIIGARAIGTAGGPAKCALAAAHGYDAVIDYRAGDFQPRVMELTGGRGVDVVYDSVGRDTWRGSLKSLRRRGMFVCFGQSSGTLDEFRFNDLGAGSLTANRPTLFDYIVDRDELVARSEAMFAHIGAGRLTARIDQRFGLRDVAEAHRALEGRGTTGATVLIP